MKAMLSTRRRLTVFGVLGLAVLAAAGWKLWASDRPNPAAVALGKNLFTHVWQPGDSLSPAGDGLGPVFNATSCTACHFQGGVGGAGPNSANVVTFSVHPTPGNPQVYHGVVHASAVSDDYRETFDTVRNVYPVVAGSVRDTMGGCRITVPSFDPVRFETVNTPALFGVGELARISDRSIKWNRWKRTLSAVGNELSGQIPDTMPGRLQKVSGGVGKFGWKGQFAGIEEFVAVACAVEMGLTNPLFKQQKPQAYVEDTDASLDIDSEQLAALVAFVEALPRPEQILPSDPLARANARRGEKLFTEVGCADCHTPEIGGVEGVYSDFLLYDLEDKVLQIGGGGYGPEPPPETPWPDNVPELAEWKTPPLWGVADSAPYFHDGRSPTLEAAIERHSGDATRVRERYRNLPAKDRHAILTFLGTLRAPGVR